MMSFLHPQRVAHGIAQSRPAAIVFVRGFRKNPVAAYSNSYRVLGLARCHFPSPRAMAFRRKIDDDRKLVVNSDNALRKLLFSAITRHDSLEVALLDIMKTHDFNISMLNRVLIESHLKVSFSKVKYNEIAPFVGLQPGLGMDDIKSFTLHHSRIPTALFKTIVQDMDVMLMQYGPPYDHETEEVRSRFLSPIFNRLITVFGFAFRNLSESIIEGHITTRGRVEYYFKTLGSIAVLFIEMKFKVGSRTEISHAVAQIIVECDACYWNNKNFGFHIPVYGILCDGDAFEFFHFDGATKPASFQRGLDPGHPSLHLLRAFQLPDLAKVSNTHSYIDALRPICEIIFDLLLSGYVSSLKEYYNCIVDKSIKDGQKWEEVISAADRALQGFRDAEMKCQTHLIDEANLIVEEAITNLTWSVDAIPILVKPKLIMSGWDDKEIEKV